MARSRAPLLAFNRGEVSKIALARVDVAKLQLSAQCQVNWLPRVIGPMMLRPGTVQVGEILNDAPEKLLPFVYAKLDTSLIELTANIMRIWINEVLLTRIAVGTTMSDPTFQGGGTWSATNTTSGCTATIGGGSAVLTASAVGGLSQIAQTLTIASGDQNKEHGLRVVITNGPVTIRIGSSAGADDYLEQTAIDTGAHSLAYTPTGGSAYLQIESTDQWSKTLSSVTIEGAGAVEVPTPWALTDLPNVRIDQAGDIVYVACYGHMQRMIQRRGVRPGARGWSVEHYRSSDGPLNSEPVATCNLTPSTSYGNGTITADKPVFNSQQTGMLIQLFQTGQSEQTLLGALDAATEAVRVNGVGTAARDYLWAVSGTFIGTIVLERSFDGPSSGFSPVTTGAPGSWTLDYTGLTGSFAVGDGIKGLTSDASGFVTAFTSTALTLRSVTGVFLSGETITASYFSSGTATVSSFAADNLLQLTAPGTLASNTGTTDTPDLDNVIAWERLRITSYTSGAFNVISTYTGGGGYGLARVTGYVSSTVVNVEILQPFSSLAATENWVFSTWSADQGWPTSVCFHEGRLWWFSGGPIPIAGSVSNNFTSYAEQDEFGNVLGDDGAILEDFGSGPMDTVSWGLSLTRLLLGREQSIASARSSNFDQAMTPTDFVVRDCSDQGAQRLPAIKIGKRGIFVQQSNRKVYELAFNPQEFDYGDRDLTKLNLDIGVPGFVAIAKATQPDKMIHLPRGDGQSAELLYDVDDDVEAWWRIMTLGVIEDTCVLPSAQIEDLSYFVVNRTINGTTRRFIERMARRDQCVGGNLNYQLDCALVYSSAALATLQIPWLPSTTIAVWADGAAIGATTTDGSGNFTMPDGKSHANVVAGLAGAVIIGSTDNPLPNNSVPNEAFSAPQGTLTVGTQYNGYPCEVFADIAGTGRPPQHLGSLTVANGVVTLPNDQVAATIVACLGFVAPFMSSKLAVAAPGGSTLAQTKKIDQVALVLFDTADGALLQGQSFANLDAMPSYESGAPVPEGTVWSEYDGPAHALPGSWDTDARICLLAQAPNPCTAGAVVVAVTASDV